MKSKWVPFLLALSVFMAGAARAENESVTLGDLQSFELHNFEMQNFDSGREMIPPEMMEYARKAIQNDERLQYRSPGEGIVHFYCADSNCGKIRVEVTHGEDGPVVWQTTQRYQPWINPWITITDPDSRQFAKKVMGLLAEDYTRALKAIPLKVPIKDE